MQEFKLPDLGEGMQEAEIRRWLVQPGDTVKRDQPMVEVETDKAVVEIPSPTAGRVIDIRIPAGSVAKLGEVLVTFDGPTEKTALPSTAGNGTTAPAKAQTQAPPVSARKMRVLAAPAVRKRAFELNIDLEQVPPTQAHGRVTLEDLEAYARKAQHTPTTKGEQRPATTPEPILTQQGDRTVPLSEVSATEEREPLAGLRRRIAERMERSWRTIPHATAFDELDGSELIALRQTLKPLAEQRGVRLTYMPLLIKLLLPVLKEFPIFNASLDEERREIVYKRFYHIGIATDTPEGLLVSVLRNAERLSLIQIAQELERLVTGSQRRSLSLSEVTGSTFTLNNVGSFGGSSGTPIINYPEVAILAVGRLQEKAVVRNGSIIARPMLPLALSFDHRLIDGALAGRFLSHFKTLVEQPQQLMLDMI
jgi:pyruvate dehydrogenase E2 component (dihydrolipoamide acetyltransferase)